jgi:2-polyprenyl-3-methyl-5-hydroxy-6-metoxy-1,4-benzoquinol methylase
MSSGHTATLTRPVTDQIRSYSCPTCSLCGSQGELLYKDLEDKLYGAPGVWTFKRCPAIGCGLLWLDPMPVEEDVSKAYAKYYTHGDIPANSQESSSAERFPSILRIFRDLLLRATSISRERRRLASMYLDEVPPGRVLDVGCGDGSRLERLRALGWDVSGQEIDGKAASHAIQFYGVQVHLGSLSEADFGEGSFDAIVMNHVVEHVHDPVRLFSECRHLLKKNGVLVAVTPNSESCGHKRFGPSWRGLEPPRHIHLFNQSTLRKLAGLVGFRDVNTWTTPAHAEVLANGSLEICGESKPVGLGLKLMRRIMSLQYQLRWHITHMTDGNSGEECVLKVVA